MVLLFSNCMFVQPFYFIGANNCFRRKIFRCFKEMKSFKCLEFNFLLFFSSQGLMLLLQNLPTHNWLDSHISVLVAEAFRLKFTYADAPKHFEVKS